MVRLYRNYDPAVDQGPVQMVSAFRGLTELVNIRQGAGIVMDWKQSTGILLVGGDSRTIKVWDAQTETPILVSDLDCHNKLSLILIRVPGFGHQLGQPCHRHSLRHGTLPDIRCEFRQWRSETL